MASTLNFVQNSLKNWWIPVLLGAIFIALGFYLFTQPEATYDALSWLWSFSFLAIGIIQIIFALSNTKSVRGWGWYLVIGIISASLGILLLSSDPNYGKGAYAYFIGFFVIFQSIAAIATSIDIQDTVKGWGWILTFGILGLILGIYLLYNINVAAFTAVVWTAVSFIIIGIGSVILGFNFRRIAEFPNKVSQKVKDQIADLQKNVKDQVNSLQEAITNPAASSTANKDKE